MTSSPGHPPRILSGGAVLVTGGAGFIGSHVVEALLARGTRVVVLDSFDTSYDPEIKRRNLTAAAGDARLTLIEGDIRDDSALAMAFAEGPFDGVIHLAARAGVRQSLLDPVLYQEVNVTGTTRVLEYARQTGAHFVLGSSSSVYGATSSAPFSEADAADRPSSPYAATKRSNELTCYAYHHLYHLPVTCLRFFTVYGPRQRPEMAIHRFAALIDGGRAVELYGNGSSLRDYTYIDDIVDGVLSALDHPAGYRIYNLGTTATTSLIALAGTLARALDQPLQVRYLPEQPGDVPLTFADISLARDALGYQPRVSLAEGLRHFVEWFRRERMG